MSEGHQRQMMVFTENPSQFMDDFSQEFEGQFMHLMETQYRSTRVLANTVYCGVVSDKHHMHMNATIWNTLSIFVQYIGRTGKCKIDKTAKGWYLEYIDPEREKRREEDANKKLRELNEEEERNKEIERMVQLGEKSGGFQEAEYTTLQRENPDEKVSLGFFGGEKKEPKLPAGANVFESMQGSGGVKRAASMGKLSAMDELMRENEEKKRRTMEKAEPVVKDEPAEAEDAPWVAPGLVVKVMNKDLANGKYHKKKGKVLATEEYTAALVMIDDGAKLKLDQDYLETVLPSMGNAVRVVRGKYRGEEAELKSIEVDDFACTVKLSSTGKTVSGLDYADVCKLAR